MVETPAGPGRSSAPLRTLIVDDSAVYRRLLRDALREISGLEILGEAANGQEALDLLARRPADLVLLDVEMPVLDGFSTLRILLREHPGLSVVMVSGVDRSSAGATIRALATGAVDFVAKPQGEDPEQSHRRLVQALKPRIALASTRRWLGQRATAVPKRAERPRPRTEDAGSSSRLTAPLALAVIGTSTGGPAALAQLLPVLEPSISVPILVVQHMPAAFTAALAEQLDRQCSLPVREAIDGQPLEPGTVFVARGGSHLVLRGSGSALRLGLDPRPPENGCRPSLDVLFDSLARWPRGTVLTATLTGMGRDGTAGLGRLPRERCYNLVQDEASAVVYGMPRAVFEAGLADEQLALEHLGPRINLLLRRWGAR